jgi:hypothetical protein
VESDKNLALRLQDLLYAHFDATLDLVIACSVSDGTAYLCAHRVSLILIGLAASDFTALDAVRVLRFNSPDSGLIAYGCVVDERLRLDAIRAGAHEVLSITDTSADGFRLVVECAMIRAKHTRMDAGPTPPGQPVTVAPSTPELAHDLNNAMTSINGFADILLARLPPDEPARTCAAQIKMAGTRAAELVKVLMPPDKSPPAFTTDPNVTARAA